MGLPHWLNGLFHGKSHGTWMITRAHWEYPHDLGNLHSPGFVAISTVYVCLMTGAAPSGPTNNLIWRSSGLQLGKNNKYDDTLIWGWHKMGYPQVTIGFDIVSHGRMPWMIRGYPQDFGNLNISNGQTNTHRWWRKCFRCLGDSPSTVYTVCGAMFTF